VGLRAAIVPDISAFRHSRDFRVIELGAIVAGLGNQAALVAVPFQVYALTRSPALVGLIGAAELGPMIVVYLFGGALADRMDRRRILAAAQLGTAASAGTLAVLSFTGPPPAWAIFLLAPLLAASGSLDLLSRQAMVVSLSGEWLRSAIAFAFAMSELVAIAGPGLGGVLIGAAGVGWVYAIDAASIGLTLYAVATIGPQLPTGDSHRGSLLGSVADGLRHVRSSRALLGSFAIDLCAMTFGMPRALFVVLSVNVYHAGAAGTGLLYAAVSFGAGLAA
jgi:MFS family permease